MRFLLDTNICATLLNGKDQALSQRLYRLDRSQVYLCSVVKAELLFGAEKSQQRVKNLEKLELFFNEFRSLPFDDSAAEKYGVTRKVLEQSGIPVGANDLMIASIALQHSLILVTRNIREFEQVPYLRLEQW